MRTKRTTFAAAMRTTFAPAMRTTFAAAPPARIISRPLIESLRLQLRAEEYVHRVYGTPWPIAMTMHKNEVNSKIDSFNNDKTTALYLLNQCEIRMTSVILIYRLPIDKKPVTVSTQSPRGEKIMFMAKAAVR
eukprot:758036-Hanusia_phi.AAC.1